MNRGWLVQGDVVMLAVFNTMFEMFKRGNSEGATAGHLSLLQKF